MCPGKYLSFFVTVCLVRRSVAADGIRCEITNQDALTRGSSPVKFSSTESMAAGRFSQCVHLHIRLRPTDFNNATNHSGTIIIQLSAGSVTITIKKSGRIKWKMKRQKGTCDPTFRHNQTMWGLAYSCVRADAGSAVSASFRGSTLHVAEYAVPDPVPLFRLSVAPGSRTVTVTLSPGAAARTTLCYRVTGDLCRSLSAPTTIDPAKSLSAALNVSYLLPCVCVQVFYTHSDAKRVTECPFTNISVDAMKDVWLASEFTLYEDRVAWTSRCPPSYLKPSAALCWRNGMGICTPILNSRLKMINSSSLLYNISTLDKHSQMCLQFSLKDNHHVHCPFKSGKTEWQARVGPGWRSVLVHLTSDGPASFSVQLCVPRHGGCFSTGRAYSGSTDGHPAELQLNVPLQSIGEKPCVQVWKSEPAQLGKRILCPKYTHWRGGMMAAAALVIGVTLALLAFVVYKVMKSGTKASAGWLSIHKPVLLVCSSGHPAHVSAVCALASILQGELCAAVRMALWSQRSERQPGAAGPASGTGVADLGPLPWLYGEWDAVQRARGKVLVVWSPEAKRVFERTRERKTEAGRRTGEGARSDGGAKRGRAAAAAAADEPGATGDRKRKERTATRGTEEDATLLEEEEEEEEEEEAGPASEGSSITGPVLRATLARLKGVLRDPGRSHPVVLISLRGLNHNRDIPAELRGVPRYSLPGDFRGLIQELGGTAPGPHRGESGCGCWPRLLSKILSLWLARRLAHQLKTWLP